MPNDAFIHYLLFCYNKNVISARIGVSCVENSYSSQAIKHTAAYSFGMHLLFDLIHITIAASFVCVTTLSTTLPRIGCINCRGEVISLSLSLSML